MPGPGESGEQRRARWDDQIADVRRRGFSAPGLVAEIVLTDIVMHYGPLVPLGRMPRTAGRQAVRDRRVVGFRQERSMGSGDVYVVDVSRERDAAFAYVLPEPLRIDDVQGWLKANPWESLSEMVAWLDSIGAIASAPGAGR